MQQLHTSLKKKKGEMALLFYIKHNIEDFRPEWCISTIVYIMLEIHHSGWEPSNHINLNAHTPIS